MRVYDLILKKRNGGVLSKEEIDFIVDGYVKGEIPDYQISALLMAIYFKKMNSEETLNLTLAMRDSGDIIDLSKIDGIKVDKHSTGGVGDKTSLVVTPMVAACGVKVAKMSGRGLGHTGGTVDKLESFTGFSTALTIEQFIEQVNRIGIAITGQTGNLAPADKKLYALRDVTGTIENISLIASSIMSKKLASGADAIVLDVKTGSGAFMKTEEDSFALAKEMVEIGKGAGKNTIGVVTEMDEPLGFAIGNALEIKEVIESLKGNGPKDLMELSIELGSNMLIAANPELTEKEARNMLQKAIDDGSALKKFIEFVTAQGGNSEDVVNTDRLPKAKIKYEIKYSGEKAFVSKIRSDELGRAVMILGGGREKKGDSIDYAVGIIIKKKVSDEVNDSDVLCEVYANTEEKLSEIERIVLEAYKFSKIAVDKPKMIKGVVR